MIFPVNGQNEFSQPHWHSRQENKLIGFMNKIAERFLEIVFIVLRCRAVDIMISKRSYSAKYFDIAIQDLSSVFGHRIRQDFDPYNDPHNLQLHEDMAKL